MMYEGDMTVEGIQAYASEEFGVEFGQQDRLQDTVQATEQSQERLNNIQAKFSCRYIQHRCNIASS